MGLEPKHVRDLLRRHGHVKGQDVQDWKGSFPLHDSVVAFYRDVGPLDVTIRGYGNPFFLPMLARLWDYQAGYRWDGLTGTPVSDWSIDWVVVADDGSGAFIFSRRSGRVSYSLHGAGRWQPTELFPDIHTMAACLATLGTVVEEAGKSLTDDDGVIKAELLETARQLLSDILGSAEQANLVLITAGWM